MVSGEEYIPSSLRVATPTADTYWIRDNPSNHEEDLMNSCARLIFWMLSSLRNRARS